MKISFTHVGSMMMLCFAMIVMVGCVGMPPTSQPVVSKRTQMHMGTLVTITVVASDKDAGYRAIQAGFDEIKRLEQLLSTWRSRQ